MNFAFFPHLAISSLGRIEKWTPNWHIHNPKGLQLNLSTGGGGGVLSAEFNYHSPIGSTLTVGGHVELDEEVSVS